MNTSPGQKGAFYNNKKKQSNSKTFNCRHRNKVHSDFVRQIEPLCIANMSSHSINNLFFLPESFLITQIVPPFSPNLEEGSGDRNGVDPPNPW